MNPVGTRIASALIVVVWLLHTSSNVAARELPRVRVLDPGLKARLELAMTRSPTLKSLLARLESASVLAFVDCSPRMPNRIGARLNLITSVNGLRYVRIELDCGLGDRPQIGLLAHELQHAWEVGSRPDIIDDGDMQLFFEEYGFQSYDDGYHASYETQDAIDMQHQVLIEIDQNGRSRRGKSPSPAAY